MKLIKTTFIGIALSFLLLLSANLFAQSDNGNEPINMGQQQIIIEKAIILLKENYVFPERIKKIETDIKSKLKNAGYQQYATLFDFLEQLNKDFEVAGNDHHLNIFYGPQYVKKIIAAANSTDKSDEKVPEEFIRMVKYENYFIKKTERLDGNIGYLKFNKFEELQFAKGALTSAISLISNSNAIIVDLRENGGGSAETVHFLVSHFLPDSTKLGTFKSKNASETKELWTIKDPAIKKIDSRVPLYILVSKRTSSAAESFAYTLQQFKRAMIVGEQTHGEANPGLRLVINEKLYMIVPTHVNRSAVTGTNWEGVGVTPDIKTSLELSLPSALLEICKLLANTDNKLYKWMQTEFEAQLSPELPKENFIKALLGNYGEQKFALENGNLYFISKTNKRKMNYLKDGLFAVEGRKDYRIAFDPNSNVIDKVEFRWDDGTIDKYKKMD